MKFSFYGAAREVTGSCHLVDTGAARFLLDCGMIQGGRERHERNRETFPFEVGEITRVILSHAHIDHSGRLPLLRKVGYRGPILTTEPTARLLEIHAGRFRPYPRGRRAGGKSSDSRNAGRTPAGSRHCTPRKTRLPCSAQIETVAFNQPHELDGAGTVTFVPAGHILGAAVVDLQLGTGDESRRLRVLRRPGGSRRAGCLDTRERYPAPTT